MKKTVTANVSGTVFHIEEDAYDQLQRYLGGIRAQLEGNAGREEILADVEARVAELFSEQLDGKREVVSLADVEHVMNVMGKPEDYGDGPGATDGAASGNSGQRGYKRFFRDPHDKWVGGVIGGLAAYIGMDPIWLRIIMIIFILLGKGTPILLYVLLWILVPKAETAADRLRMDGEPVTVDNLKRAFEEGGKKVADEARSMGSKWGQEAKRRSGHAGDVIAKLFGAGIVLFAFSMLLGLVSAVVGGTFGLWHATWGSDELGLLDFGALVFQTREHALWMLVGASLICLIPIVAVLLAGFRLLLNTHTPGWLGWSLGLLWIAALVPTVIGGLSLAREFQRHEKEREAITLTSPQASLLYLDAMGTDNESDDLRFSFDDDDDFNCNGLRIEGDSITADWARIDVEQSPDSLYHLVVVREAFGRTAKLASSAASGIRTEFRLEGDVLRVSPLLRFAQSEKIRAQQARFTLLVPVGKGVFFRAGSKRVIYDVDNVTDTRDSRMIGKAWRMTPKGLEEGMPGEDRTDIDDSPKEQEPTEKKDSEGSSTIEASASQPLRLPSLLGLLRLPI
jgi:phage shock protein PspC (stress-responsive transcriptional regulator)